MRFPKVPFVLVAASLAVILALPAPLSAAPSLGATDSGIIEAEAFEFGYRDGNGLPTTIVIAGDSVRWTNIGILPHTVTDGVGGPLAGAAFDSGIMSPGQKFTVAFPSTGVFPYFCTLHETMRGLLVVV